MLFSYFILHQDSVLHITVGNTTPSFNSLLHTGSHSWQHTSFFLSPKNFQSMHNHISCSHPISDFYTNWKTYAKTWNNSLPTRYHKFVSTFARYATSPFTTSIILFFFSTFTLNFFLSQNLPNSYTNYCNWRADSYISAVSYVNKIWVWNNSFRSRSIISNPFANLIYDRWVLLIQADLLTLI